MYRHYDRMGSGCNLNADPWGAYRGKYPDPTPYECRLISRYLKKFAWEDDAFIEHNSPRWLSLKNRLQCPNLRELLIKFIRQVRWSKGYDVDLHFDFIDFPFTIFVPQKLDDNKFYHQAMAATKFAIREINAQMMRVGKSYEFESVEKSVLATHKTYKIGIPGGIVSNILLLTFTAKENISVAEITFQAMLILEPLSTFQLKEWKYKPLLI